MTDLTDGVPFIPAVHFNVGREGRPIDMLILHEMDGTLASTDATFAGGNRIASATYGIEDAVIHQYVRESDGSYNADDWDANMRSISIEHSATPTRAPSAATLETSIQVCAAMMRKYPAIGNRVYPHNHFTATYCPGTLPWQSIRDEAVRRVHGAVPPPPPPPPPPPSHAPVAQGPHGGVWLSKMHVGQTNSDSVKALQQALRDYPNISTIPLNPSGVTGNYGSETAAMVRKVYTTFDQWQPGAGWGSGDLTVPGRALLALLGLSILGN